MIEKIKLDIGEHIGDKVTIIYNGSRNKVEQYDAQITGLYNFIFTVKLNDGGDLEETKSFSYSDVLTKTIQIFYN